MNIAFIIGRLGQDPETKTLDSGTTVCNFSVATSEKWKDKDGNQKEDVDWHNVVAWGKLADICGTYLRRGSQVAIQGTIKYRTWEKDDGTKGYATDIKAFKMEMLGSKGEPALDTPASQQPAQSGDNDVMF